MALLPSIKFSGTFNFCYCYCWYTIMVRRPLLPFLTCSHFSWLFPPQRMLDKYGFLPWSCCGSVYSCSRCAIHAGSFLRGPAGLCMSVMCHCGRLSHPCWLWVDSSSSPYSTFKWFVPGRLFKSKVELKMWLVTSQTSACSHFVLEEPW